MSLVIFVIDHRTELFEAALSGMDEQESETSTSQSRTLLRNALYSAASGIYDTGNGKEMLIMCDRSACVLCNRALPAVSVTQAEDSSARGAKRSRCDIGVTALTNSPGHSVVRALLAYKICANCPAAPQASHGGGRDVLHYNGHAEIREESGRPDRVEFQYPFHDFDKPGNFFRQSRLLYLSTDLLSEHGDLTLLRALSAEATCEHWNDARVLDGTAPFDPSVFLRGSEKFQGDANGLCARPKKNTARHSLSQARLRACA